VARLAERWDETPTARTLVLAVPGWPGHLAGQHVDVRLTAADGYTAQRSYSVATPASGDLVTLTVQRLDDGEVSPFLAGPYAVGDPVEVRGPVGGWFVWRPADAEPVLLVAGGSGVVPLMAMIRARRAAGSTAPFRLLYSVRSPADRFYRSELDRLAPIGAGPAGGPAGQAGEPAGPAGGQAGEPAGPAGEPAGADDAGVEVGYAYTRAVPPGWPRPPGRLDAALLRSAGWSPVRQPACFVCGPTGFVETAANILVDLGHDPSRIRTERFGGS
jgi:ferredoxin-NADP reductase